MFTHIDVSRRLHCAGNNLTGDTPSRASPDAYGPPPYAIWLSAGIPHFTAVFQWPKPNGDCRLLILLALQRVPDRARLSRRASRYPARLRWSALYRRATDRLDALAPTLPGRHTQSRPADLWLVPHPVELCHPRGHAAGQTWHCGL